MRNISPTLWNLAAMFGLWAALLLTPFVAQTSFPANSSLPPVSVSGSLG